MREVKLSIAVPCCRDWKAAFGASLCGLVHKICSQGIKGVELKGFDMNIMQGASVLPRARQMAFEHAYKIGATHLLCIDDDMAFPSDIIDDLFSNDVDITACNYVTKGACKPLVHGLNGQPVRSMDKLGSEEVAWVGFGFVLIKLASVKDIPKPLFEMRWLEDRQDFMGEDFYFCAKAKAHGAKIYVNHDASQKITHVGDYAYREIH